MSSDSGEVARRVVLVLEDDDDIRDAVAMLLAEEGYVVKEAANLTTARAILAETHVDAAVLDMRLGAGEFGGALAVELATAPDGPTVILLSASTELALPIAQVHGLTWVQKPFECERLVDVLRVSLEMRGRRRVQARPRPLAEVIDISAARRSR